MKITLNFNFNLKIEFLEIGIEISVVLHIHVASIIMIYNDSFQGDMKDVTVQNLEKYVHKDRRLPLFLERFVLLPIKWDI